MGVMSGLHIVMVPAWWPTPEQPHAGIFFCDYADAFRAAGAQVGVVYPDLVGVRSGLRASASLRPVIHFDATTHGVPVVRVRGLQTSFGRIARRAKRYRDWLARGLAAYHEQHPAPYVLHALCAVPAGWACTALPAPTAARVVLTEHTGPFSLVMSSPASSRLAHAAFASAAARVAVSPQLRAEISAAGIHNPVVVCGNPVSRTFTDSLLPKAPTKGQPIRGLFIGRFTREKGFDDLQRALKLLSPSADACLFDLVGGQPSPPLRDMPAIRVHPPLPRERLRDLMHDADFLVHPSHGESFGMVVAEALCMGMPVITTRGTACADFITGDNGLLVEKANVDSLLEGLRHMIRIGRTYDRARIAADARARFSAEAVAAYYAPIFRRVAT